MSTIYQAAFGIYQIIYQVNIKWRGEGQWGTKWWGINLLVSLHFLKTYWNVYILKPKTHFLSKTKHELTLDFRHAAIILSSFSGSFWIMVRLGKEKANMRPQAFLGAQTKSESTLQGHTSLTSHKMGWEPVRSWFLGTLLWECGGSEHAAAPVGDPDRHLQH